MSSEVHCSDKKGTAYDEERMTKRDEERMTRSNDINEGDVVVQPEGSGTPDIDIHVPGEANSNGESEATNNTPAGSGRRASNVSSFRGLRRK